MIIYVDMEHFRLRETTPEYYAKTCERRLRAKYSFEQLSGQACYILHYSRFSLDKLRELSPDLVIFSGNNTDYSHYAAEYLERIKSYFLNPPYPTFAICGSFHIMAEAYGVKIGAMGALAEGKDSKNDPILPQGAICENGFCDVNLIQTDEGLFAGFPEKLVVHQHHYWEVKSVPEDFHLRACSRLCGIQALEHRAIQLAGVQFHPEDYDETHADGGLLLRSLLKSYLGNSD